MHTLPPEHQLQDLFSQLVHATSAHSATRKTAVRWFNRLYFDVRKWNNSFIEFLHTYPGFKHSATADDYRTFLQALREYRDSLSERYGIVKNDLCSNLKILSARFTKDFAWLHKEDEHSFWEIRRLIDDSYATESGIIGIAYSVCEFIWEIAANDQEWHVQHHDEVVARIQEYENASRHSVSELQKMASEVGVNLLSVSEYEAALTAEGSQNPNLLVIGELSMSQDNISVHGVVGPVNIKSRLERVSQTVSAANRLASTEKEHFQQLLSELSDALQPALERSPQDVDRVVQAAQLISSEVTKDQPSKRFLGLSVEGLKEAALAIGTIAPAVMGVAERIGEFVGGLTFIPAG